jgi:hypothetical protein
LPSEAIGGGRFLRCGPALLEGRKIDVNEWRHGNGTGWVDDKPSIALILTYA